MGCHFPGHTSGVFGHKSWHKSARTKLGMGDCLENLSRPARKDSAVVKKLVCTLEANLGQIRVMLDKLVHGACNMSPAR
eukprot:4416299-Pleurochrysis_carterae.AAC.1